MVMNTKVCKDCKYLAVLYRNKGGMELYEYQKNLDYKTNAFDYDWIVNFLFFFIPQVRRWYVYFACLGWQTTFNSCKGLMMNEVLSAMNLFPGYKVVCCGHSYGGAGSVLVGIEIFFQTGIKPDLITFGEPKPLEAKMAAVLAATGTDNGKTLQIDSNGKVALVTV